MRSNDEEIPYRTPVTPETPVSTVPRSDLANYDALKRAEKVLVDAVNGLYADFNAFDVLLQDLPYDAAQKLLRQIDGKQIAHGYLVEALDGLQAAIIGVERELKPS